MLSVHFGNNSNFIKNPGNVGNEFTKNRTLPQTPLNHALFVVGTGSPTGTVSKFQANLLSLAGVSLWDLETLGRGTWCEG